MSTRDRQTWTEQEDAAIVTLVEEHGDKKLWSIISKLMSDRFGILKRSGKQCRERWYNHLCPGISKRAWSDVEEKLIFEAHAIHGNKWSEIAKQLEGRTENSIKNFFYSRIRKRMRHYNKHRPEEEQIIGSVTNVLKNRQYAKLLLAQPKNSNPLGLIRINETKSESASSIDTAASPAPRRLSTESMPSMNILVSATVSMQRPPQMSMNDSSMNQSAMYQTQMPQSAFGYMQHGNSPQRPAAYKQMRPQGVMIPTPMPIQSVNVQNMIDPGSNPPSGQLMSPYSPFDLTSPAEFLSPLYMPNTYPY